MGSVLPGGYSTVMIKTSRPGLSVRSFDMSDVTLACCAITVPVERNSRTIMSIIFFIIDLSFLACVRFIWLHYKCEVHHKLRRESIGRRYRFDTLVVVGRTSGVR